MSRFFFAIDEIIDWFYDVWDGIFSSVISPDNAFYRSIIYAIFTISIMGFCVDLIFSFILSYKNKRVIIFNPLKAKLYFGSDHKNFISHSIKNSPTLFNRSFSTLLNRNSDRQFINLKQGVSDRQFNSLKPGVSDRQFNSLKPGVSDRQFNSLKPGVSDRQFNGLKLGIVPFKAYPLKSSFFRNSKPKLFRVPENKPFTIPLTRLSSLTYSNLKFSYHFSAFPRKLINYDLKTFSTPSFRMFYLLNPKFLSFMMNNRLSVLAYRNFLSSKYINSSVSNYTLRIETVNAFYRMYLLTDRGFGNKIDSNIISTGHTVKGKDYAGGSSGGSSRGSSGAGSHSPGNTERDMLDDMIDNPETT